MSGFGVAPSYLQHPTWVESGDRAPQATYCASVSQNVRCVSTIVRLEPASVSDNVRRKRRSIARRAVHYCAPLQLVSVQRVDQPFAVTLAGVPPAMLRFYTVAYCTPHCPRPSGSVWSNVALVQVWCLGVLHAILTPRIGTRLMACNLRLDWKHGVHSVLHAMITRHKPHVGATNRLSRPKSAQNGGPYRIESQHCGRHTLLAAFQASTSAS